MKYLIAIACLSLFGCATSYVEPESKEVVKKEQSHNFSDSEIASKAKTYFAINGFQIISNDEGIMKTAYKFQRMTPLEADCGKTFGIDYLKDKRTKTEVSYTLINKEGKLLVVSDIKGEYKPGAISQDITLSCSSRGLIESTVIDGILGA